MKTWFLKSAILGMAALSLNAHCFGEKADRKQKVNINSIDFEGDQGKGVYKLSRNVSVTQGTLKITADKADIRTTEDEQYIAVLTAKPVCFRQRTDNGNWAQGVAERVEYDSARGIVELFGNAIMFVGDDETRANYIIYNTQLGTYEARDSKDKKTTGKGVTFVLQPRERDEKPVASPAASSDTSAPAAATTAPAAPPAAPVAPPKAAAKPIIVQQNPPKRNEPAFSRCA
jgi:lipopolysaccharide export system protein LptA